MLVWAVIGRLSCSAGAQVADFVVRTVDGDTVILEKHGRARLIGVDTPESVRPEHPVDHFGKEASDFARLHLSQRAVRVDFDTAREDSRGRKLVYLYLEDGSLFNALLIEKGFGIAYTAFDFRRRQDFLRLEDRARKERQGLWKHWLPEDWKPVYHGNTQSLIYHAQLCEHFDCRHCTEVLSSREEAENRGFRPHWDCIRPW